MVTDSNSDAYWVAQAVVIFFTFLGLIGLSLIEAGLSRQRHHLMCLLKNFVQISIGVLVFWLLGFGFFRGKHENHFIGGNHYGGEDWENTYHYNRAAMYGLYGLYVVFIINGALAERLQLWASVTYSFWIMLFIYPVIAHWAWGHGWLDENLQFAYIDRGGNGVVHILGGSIALVGLLFTGARLGKKKPEKVDINGVEYDNIPQTFIPASPELVVAGYLFLILSVLAISSFRGHSTLEKLSGAFNTLLSGSLSCIVAVIFYTLFTRDLNYHYEAVLQGFLAGEIAVTSVARNTEPWDAFIIGVFAGLLFAGTARLLKWVPRVDDATNTVAVHLVNGIWGVLATGFFDDYRGVFHQDGKGGGSLFGSQVVGAVSITGWGLFFGTVMFGYLYFTKFLRVKPEIEVIGLNYASINWKGFFIDHSKIEIAKS